MCFLLFIFGLLLGVSGETVEPWAVRYGYRCDRAKLTEMFWPATLSLVVTRPKNPVKVAEDLWKESVKTPEKFLKSS
jgi:tRNA A37 threonylcarbamoyladenosine synthetase subunit TsaC/SUA5/YrdC